MALLLACSWSSMGQTTEVPAAELNSTPPAQVTEAGVPAPTKAPDAAAVVPSRKIRYGLSAGTHFSNLYGTATFLEPSVMLPITNRFSGFASLSMVTSFGANAYRSGSDAVMTNNTALYNQRLILNAGGNYMVNDRLNLTGTVWRDLSKNPMPPAVNLLMPGGTNGMSLRANYKVTDNLSVSGGLRFSNGNAYNSMWYNPGNPFGY